MISVGGKPVQNIRDFSLDLYEYKIRQTVTIGVLRDGQQVMVMVTVAKRPDDPQRFADMVASPDNLIERLGIVALNVNAEVEQLLGDQRISGGVLVAARTPTGIPLGEEPQPGDVIHAINAQPADDILLA